MVAAVITTLLAGSMLVAPPAMALSDSSSVPATQLSTLSDVGSACEELESLELEETIALTAELVTTGEAAGQDKLPEFCRVALTVRPAINVEVWLPTGTYNHRFQAVGGGGYAGSLSYPAMAGALRSGYATSSTDTGHVGGSGSFALNADGTPNDQLIEDFASRSVIEMTLKAKDIIAKFYGAESDYNYWSGCSLGGRQGMVLAQQLPDAYDGILAGAPPLGWDRLFIAQLWPWVVMQNDLGGQMSACKLNAFHEAAVAQCDGYDGVVDGVVGDPTLCDFDPASLVGQELECGVITEDDASVISKIYEGPLSSTGEKLWYGPEPGAGILTAYAGEPFQILVDHLLYWLKKEPTFDWRTLDPSDVEGLFAQAEAELADVIGSDNTDLRPFHKAGGKLVTWMGWLDGTSATQFTDYYEQVANVAHPVDVQDFARLFLAPGVGHCGGGPGPNVFDAFTPLVDWVENGVAPESIVASDILDGQVVRTQPLCAYPMVAAYDGEGDVNSASSYTCSPAYHTVRAVRVVIDQAEHDGSLNGRALVEVRKHVDQAEKLMVKPSSTRAAVAQLENAARKAGQPGSAVADALNGLATALR